MSDHEYTNSMQPAFSIALMAGGQSSRMGRDKGLLPFLGQPLPVYILEQIADLSDDIFIVSNNAESYPPIAFHIHSDVIPGIGALGGIHSALSYAQHPLCLVLACDMPFVSRELIQRLIEAAEGVDAVIPQLAPEKLEPFRAVYRRTCLPAVEAAIQSGERRAISFLPQVRTQWIPKPLLEALDPGLDTFLNINTPDDLARIEAYAAQRRRAPGRN